MKSFLHQHMTNVHGFRLAKTNNHKNSHIKKTTKSKILESGSVKCVLCGKSIESGKMLAHKQQVHGEKPYSSSTVGRSPSSQWVRVFQGGLPGLGKRHR